MRITSAPKSASIRTQVGPARTRERSSTRKVRSASPAWILGIDRETGTLEPGKRADVVVWSSYPFSVYAQPDTVLIAGRVAYDRKVGITPSDFELGNSSMETTP